MTADPRIEIAARAKQCPFCGCAEIRFGYIRDGQRLSCQKCGAGVFAFNPNAHEAALQAWNGRALDAARPEVEVDKWKPIQTAPRDGTLVLLWNKGAVKPFLARYANDGWRNNHYGEREVGWYFANPTHWQPSPNPPTEATGEKR